jgi:hypothetical protein
VGLTIRHYDTVPFIPLPLFCSDGVAEGGELGRRRWTKSCHYFARNNVGLCFFTCDFKVKIVKKELYLVIVRVVEE